MSFTIKRQITHTQVSRAVPLFGPSGRIFPWHWRKLWIYQWQVKGFRPYFSCSPLAPQCSQYEDKILTLRLRAMEELSPAHFLGLSSLCLTTSDLPSSHPGFHSAPDNLLAVSCYQHLHIFLLLRKAFSLLFT